MVVIDRDWNALAEEFYNMIKNTTPQTAAIVEVSKRYDTGELDGIEIIPAATNENGTCFCLEEIVDFSRCKGLSNYVMVHNGKTLARIY